MVVRAYTLDAAWCTFHHETGHHFFLLGDCFFILIEGLVACLLVIITLTFVRVVADFPEVLICKNLLLCVLLKLGLFFG